MLKALKIIFAAARRLSGRWRVMAVLSVVYAALLASLLLFMATKEATIWQVLLTLVFAALAPALFFLLQAMMVNYARGEAQALALLRRSFTDSCKLALASLPLLLAGVVFFYLLKKLQPYPFVYTLPADSAQPVQSSVRLAPPLQWSLLMLSTLRFLLFAVVLPLAAAHLWGATLRDGLLPALKRAHHHLARAFAPEAVLIYTVGLMLFGLIPYFLLFTQTTASKPAVDFALFVARLLLVFLFTLYGWALTLDALADAGGRVASAESIAGRQAEAEAV